MDTVPFLTALAGVTTNLAGTATNAVSASAPISPLTPFIKLYLYFQVPGILSVAMWIAALALLFSCFRRRLIGVAALTSLSAWGTGIFMVSCWNMKGIEVLPVNLWCERISLMLLVAFIFLSLQPDRRMLPHRAVLFLAAFAFLFMWMNSSSIDLIREDLSRENEKMLREEREKEEKAAAERTDGVGSDIRRFAEDDRASSKDLDRAGVKTTTNDLEKSIYDKAKALQRETDGTGAKGGAAASDEKWKAGRVKAERTKPADAGGVKGSKPGDDKTAVDGDEAGYEGGGTGAVDTALYKLGGRKERAGGKKKETVGAKASVESAQGSVGRLMLPEDMRRARLLDTINIAAVRIMLVLVVLTLLLDYLSRFNTTFSTISPLPLASRTVDSLYPKNYSVLLRDFHRTHLMGFLNSVVRKGETFVYFGEKDPLQSEEKILRFHLGGIKDLGYSAPIFVMDALELALRRTRTSRRLLLVLGRLMSGRLSRVLVFSIVKGIERLPHLFKFVWRLLRRMAAWLGATLRREFMRLGCAACARRPLAPPSVAVAYFLLERAGVRLPERRSRGLDVWELQLRGYAGDGSELVRKAREVAGPIVGTCLEHLGTALGRSRRRLATVMERRPRKDAGGDLPAPAWHMPVRFGRFQRLREKVAVFVVRRLNTLWHMVFIDGIRIYLRKERFDEAERPPSSEFVFESAWFGRYCFSIVGNSLSNEMVDDLLGFLHSRMRPRASAARTVNIVWDLEPLPSATTAQLIKECREPNLRLVMVAHNGGPGLSAEAFEEVYERIPSSDLSAIERLGSWRGLTEQKISERRNSWRRLGAEIATLRAGWNGFVDTYEPVVQRDLAIFRRESAERRKSKRAEARRRAEEQRQAKLIDAARREEERKQAAELAKQKSAERARKAAEEAVRRRAEEERKAAERAEKIKEEERRRGAEAAARVKAEEARKAAQLARQKAEEERRAIAEERRKLMEAAEAAGQKRVEARATPPAQAAAPAAPSAAPPAQTAAPAPVAGIPARKLDPAQQRLRAKELERTAARKAQEEKHKQELDRKRKILEQRRLGAQQKVEEAKPVQEREVEEEPPPAPREPEEVSRIAEPQAEEPVRAVEPKAEEQAPVVEQKAEEERHREEAERREREEANRRALAELDERERAADSAAAKAEEEARPAVERKAKEADAVEAAAVVPEARKAAAPSPAPPAEDKRKSLAQRIRAKELERLALKKAQEEKRRQELERKKQILEQRRQGVEQPPEQRKVVVQQRAEEQRRRIVEQEAERRARAESEQRERAVEEARIALRKAQEERQQLEAEQSRLEEEERKRIAERKAEEERRAMAELEERQRAAELAAQKAEEEARLARQKAEEEARREEAERREREEEEQRRIAARKAEEERLAAEKRTEEERRKQAALEREQKGAVELDAKKAEEEARLARQKAEEEARRQDAERRGREEQERKRAAEIAAKKAEEEARIARLKAEEERQKVDAERRGREEQERKRAVELAAKRAEEEARSARQKAEEERQKLEAERRRREEEERRRISEQKAEEERRALAALEERKRAAELAVKRAEEEARIARLKAEEERQKVDAERRGREEEERRRISEQKAGEERRALAALEERKRVAELAAKKAEEEARIAQQKAGEERRRLAAVEQEGRRGAHRTATEVRPSATEGFRQKFERLQREKEERKRTALGQRPDEGRGVDARKAGEESPRAAEEAEKEATSDSQLSPKEKLRQELDRRKREKEERFRPVLQQKAKGVRLIVEQKVTEERRKEAAMEEERRREAEAEAQRQAEAQARIAAMKEVQSKIRVVSTGKAPGTMAITPLPAASFVRQTPPPAPAEDVKFWCAQCGQKIAVQAKLAGRTIACPSCRQALTIPAESAQDAVPPPHRAIPAEFKFLCPHCMQKLAAQAEWIGRQIDCPNCKNGLIIPSPGGE